jgi:hypothetical protein
MLWIPYIANSTAAVGRLLDDVSIGISHWPVQVGAGIAIIAATLVASFLPNHRRMAGMASSLAAVSIGVGMAAYPLSPTATESPQWGISAVLWATAVALSLSVLVPVQHRRASSGGRKRAGPQ